MMLLENITGRKFGKRA